MTDLLVPNVSISMQEVQVFRWLVDDGALVRSGQTVVEIETDKATVEVEATATGRLQVLASVGAIIAPDAVLTRILAEHEPLQTPAHASPGVAMARDDPIAPRATATAGNTAGASPAARRLAREHGIDLLGITGSGPGGRVVVDDVEQAAKIRPRSAGR